jgi:hypothetical protein
MNDVHYGRCFCGTVRVAVKGAPAAMGFCHCASCRSWSAGPVNAFTLWPPASVEVTQGADSIGTYAGSPQSHRQFCTRCGGHVMTRHPTFELVDVYAATIPTLEFVPQLHVNYAETVLPMRDGLPKFRDFPDGFGGSGEMVAE